MLVIDAANVVGSRPTGWWKDRPKAAREFVEKVRDAAVSGRLPVPVVVVLEGQARSGLPEGVADAVTVLHAPGSGDDALVAVAEEADEPVLLVSADRGLRRRVGHLAVECVGPGWIWDRLDPPGSAAVWPGGRLRHS